ncbi:MULTISPECIES: glycosyltransferase family 4 protein [Halorussus]|uniref:glycosyltransferase family 4 protein n=1 Tax=Halorussus TaxID=1070314 RepID=UPI0013B38A92|nr:MULTISPECIES: glycosyltransferase family 4 protein [Halorussus]NHN61430.1 glycosyltransferase family 4 protein [Halorussus sp. JP-T4]
MRADQMRTTADERQVTPNGDSFHVLGLVDMRVDEMRDPFEALDERASLVAVDPDEGPRAYLSALRRASRRIECRDADAVLVYNGSGLIGTVGSLLGRYHGVPVLIRQNGDIFRQHRETAREQVENGEWHSLAAHLPFALLTRAIFRGADGFVPVSAALDDVVRRQTGCPADRVISVPNPVSVDEYAPPADADSEADSDTAAASTVDSDSDAVSGVGDIPADGSERRLLTVTNLNFRGKYEGVSELLDAAVPMLRRRENLTYVIAGDGRYHKRLLEDLDALAGDVRDRIRAPGFVEDVAGLYRTADVFLYVSYIDGYPNVILEAKAAELPIVTNPAYGIAEQIDDGTSGMFVDPADPADVWETVSSLLDDPAERDRLGRNARRQVEAENDPEAVASRLYDAVRCIVDEGVRAVDCEAASGAADADVQSEQTARGEPGPGTGGDRDGR